MTRPKITSKDGPPCVCPGCYLDPAAVAEGEPVPREVCPGYVWCPECKGYVSEQAPAAKPRRRHPQGLDTDGILACFLEQQHIIERDGSGNDSVGKSKKKAKPKDKRPEQEPVGFADRQKVTTEQLGGPARVVGVRVTREVEVWLQRAAMKHRTDQSRIVRAAVLWFLRTQPELDRKTVRSNWKTRRKTTVKLQPDVWRALRAVADAHQLARTGSAMHLILDYCHRKRVDPLQSIDTKP